MPERHEPSAHPEATPPRDALAHFIAEAGARVRGLHEPAACVAALAPLMAELVAQAASFLQPQHLCSSEAGYSRHLVHEAPDAGLSLYAIVWLPGQWTPVHDHGSWGVVGVVEGALEERSYVRRPDAGGDAGIDLAPGGTVLLTPGGVSTFVPEPDHIHITGVPDGRSRTVSLHVYGRLMSDFNVYDVEGRTRQRIHVTHD